MAPDFHEEVGQHRPNAAPHQPGSRAGTAFFLSDRAWIRCLSPQVLCYDALHNRLVPAAAAAHRIRVMLKCAISTILVSEYTRGAPGARSSSLATAHRARTNSTIASLFSRSDRTKMRLSSCSSNASALSASTSDRNAH